MIIIKKIEMEKEKTEFRTITDDCKFKNEIVQAKDIETARSITGIKDLLYIDNNSKLCCTKTLESAIKMIKYNEKLNFRRISKND